MHASRWATIAALVATGCQTYSPAPVDLALHAKQFAERIPDAAALRSFAAQLRDHAAAAESFDLADGLSLGEARYVALIFNPGLRTARARAGVARACAEQAGRWSDPELSGSFFYVLEQAVRHPWFAGGAVAFTLPITGRPGLEKDLAQGRHSQALVEARIAEADVLNALDTAWVRWSAAKLSVGLIGDLVDRLAELETVAGRLAAAQAITQLAARTFTLARVARQTDLVQARNAVVTLELEIKRRLGMPPDGALTLLPVMRIAERVTDTSKRRELLLLSPRVTVAQREHDVAEKHLALAIRKQWPELTLQPGWQEEDAQPRPALSFSLPLPLWNANAREIAEARASREVAAEVLRGSLETATQDLARFEARLGAAVEQRRLIENELLPLAEQQITDARRLAELGQLDTLLLLDAVTRTYEAKAAAVVSATAEADATVEMNSLFWPMLTTPRKGD